MKSSVVDGGWEDDVRSSVVDGGIEDVVKTSVVDGGCEDFVILSVVIKAMVDWVVMIVRGGDSIVVDDLNVENFVVSQFIELAVVTMWLDENVGKLGLFVLPENFEVVNIL